MNTIEDFDEGLGTVYERFMLNDFFDKLIDSHGINRVLEVPIYGMTGLTGINSFQFTRKGCKVTLVDSRKEKIDEALQIWNLFPGNKNCEILLHQDLSKLPFADASFHLVWDFAALWHISQVESLLFEMARISSKFVLIFVPNNRQVGYFIRKYLLDKRFFTEVDEKWIDTGRISSTLISQGMKLKERGVLDVPPWPDTCFPIKKVFDKLRIRTNGQKEKRKAVWTWNIMNYYLGKDPSLKRKIDRFSCLEKMPLPWQLKALWAHHKYLLFSKGEARN